MNLVISQSETSNLAFVMALMRKEVKKMFKMQDKKLLKTYDTILNDLEAVLEVLKERDINTLARLEITLEQARMTLNFVEWYLSNNITNSIIENDFISLKDKLVEAINND
ncbi:MAG: hypothetical protein GX369_08155 [Euryarchaeota archaeon]|nr:hypothetical protein [Euryarchaeota archaeon]